MRERKIISSSLQQLVSCQSGASVYFIGSYGLGSLAIMLMDDSFSSCRCRRKNMLIIESCYCVLCVWYFTTRSLICFATYLI